ncbi:MAG: STAS domain-containing protein [Victivallales bacterium]|nr:STAS domain-containing protein [Victivallales bacterium]
MAWNIVENGKILTVLIEGHFVAAVALELKKELLEKVQAGTNVLFDLSKMVHIDATGLGVLVQVLQKVKADNGKVILAGLQEGPKIVFDITNVSHVFEIVPTLKDARF